MSMAGYILTPIGATLSIIGIPLVVYGNNIDLQIYLNSQMGVKVNF